MKFDPALGRQIAMNMLADMLAARSLDKKPIHEVTWQIGINVLRQR